eukprot:78376-Chlamydomonas_euryale.AAC.1
MATLHAPPPLRRVHLNALEPTAALSTAAMATVVRASVMERRVHPASGRGRGACACPSKGSLMQQHRQPSPSHLSSGADPPRASASAAAGRPDGAARGAARRQQITRGADAATVGVRAPVKCAAI